MSPIRERPITVAAIGLLVATMAAAPSRARENASEMLCRDVQVLVRERGRVVLATGQYTFDLFVAGRRYCLAGEMTVPALTRTLDRERCRVGYHCVGIEERDND